MTNVCWHNFARRVSVALIAIMLLGLVAPPGALLVATSRAEAAGKAKTVLVFPAADESEQKNLGDAAARLTSALALVGGEVPEIDLEVFSETSSIVRRGLMDGSIRQADIEAPKDPPVALVIGRAFRTDSVVLVGVQSLAISGEPRTADLSVIGTEYDVASNVDPDTGTVVAEPKGTTFAVSGMGKSRGKGPGDDAALMRAAAREAAYKIASVLAGKTAVEYEQTGFAPKKKSNMWTWVALGLVAIGIAAVASSGDDGGPGGAPADELLPTRLSIRASENGIRLSWVPPSTTTKSIFRYQIQRSADGSSFVRIDANRIGPSATTFTDFTAISGVAYVYQIRVLYTDGAISDWATFSQIVGP